MSRLHAIGACLLVVLVACSPSPSDALDSSARSAPASVEPTAATTSTASASASPSATPAAVATATALPTKAPATSAATAVLSEAEEALASWLRPDARVHCRPRRTDLPATAIVGVECFPDDPLVARVGIYEFVDERAAALAYLDRMSAAGVSPGSGDCNAGIPGDQGWTAGDYEGSPDEPGAVVVDGQRLTPRRHGCFRDDGGMANFRATCWGFTGTYVGVLGRTSDLAALEAWAWEYPDDVEQSTPGPPGICPYEPGLGPGSEGTDEGDTGTP